MEDTMVFKKIFLFLFTLLNSLTVNAATLSWSSTFETINRIGGYYSYAPSSIYGYPYEYHFYCGNSISNKTIDNIIFRKYFWNGSVWQVISESSVLAPTIGMWDKIHVCDPSVVQGSFKLDNISYSYAMFYTGSADPNSNGTENEIGVAFSNNLTTWKKFPFQIIKKNCTSCWGVGQPTVTSVDGLGNVLLFFTRGSSAKTSMKAVQLNLTMLSSSSSNIKVVKPEWELPTSGLNLGVNGNISSLAGADLMYDSSKDRFYMAWGSKFDSNAPAWVSNTLTISYISGSELWSGIGTWRNLNIISPSLSGTVKNFDAGFTRNFFGGVTSSSSIRVNSSATTSGTWPSILWTYRMRGNIGIITE